MKEIAPNVWTDQSPQDTGRLSQHTALTFPRQKLPALTAEFSGPSSRQSVSTHLVHEHMANGLPLPLKEAFLISSLKIRLPRGIKNGARGRLRVAGC